MDADIKNKIKNRSVFRVRYEAFQIFEDGSIFAEDEDGNIAYLVDAGSYEIFSDVLYEDDFFYCGTYTYRNKEGDRRVIPRYSISRDAAFTILKAEADSPGTQNGEREPNPAQGKDSENSAKVYSGSGFFIGNQGHFITNYHVIGKSKSIEIMHQNKSYNANIVKVNTVADLALLKVERMLTGLSLHESELPLGSDIYAYGFPQTDLQGKSQK